MLTRTALDYPRATLLGWLVLVAILALGISRTTTEVGYRILLGEDHPAIVEIDAFIDRYSGGLPIVVAWECGEGFPCGSALDAASIEMAANLEATLIDHPSVRSIASPASTPILTPDDGGLAIRRLWESGSPATDYSDLVRRAMEDPAWLGSLVSPDGTAGAMVIQTASADSASMQHLVEELFEALAPYEERGFSYRPIGDPIDFVVAGGEMKAETPRIMPVLVGLLAAMTFALSRSWLVVSLSLVVAGAALAASMGLMGWLGWPEVEWTQALPPFVLVTSICNSIHLLARLAARATQAESTHLNRAEITAAADEVWLPCVIASSTTAVSVLSFMTSGFESFLQFGVIGAAGVMTSLLVTFTALPAAITYVPRSNVANAARENSWSRFLQELVALVSRSRGLILSLSLASLAVASLGLGKLSIDIDEQALLGQGSKVVRWANWVEEHLRKADGLEIEIVLPRPEDLSSPENLAIIEDATKSLGALPELGRPSSILDPLRSAHRALSDDATGSYDVSESAPENAALLMILGMSSGAQLDSWMTIDQQRIRLSVPADPMPMKQRVRVLSDVDALLSSKLPGGWSFSITGPLKVYSDFVREIQRTQLSSFSTAAAAIWIMLVLLLRLTGSRTIWSVGWATVALAVSAFPVALTLGAMGLLGINLDAGTAMVGAVVIGVAVDDSVHLITLYRRHRREGLAPGPAIEYSIRGAGRALVTTSLALSVGFFSLLMSSWGSIASFGFLSGVAVLGALAADLLILPAIVMLSAGSASHPPRPPEEVPPGPRARAGIGLMLLATAVAIAWAALDSERLTAGPDERGESRAEAITSSHATTSQANVHEYSSPALPAALRGNIRHSAQTQSIWSLWRDSPGSAPSTSRFLVPLSALLLLVAAALVQTSQHSAAVPYAITSMLFAILGMCRGFGSSANAPFWLESLALGLMWAPLIHLSLTFPARHPLIGTATRFVPRLYCAAAVTIVPLLIGGMRSPGLFEIATLVAFGAAFFAGTIALVRMFSGPHSLSNHTDHERSALVAGVGTLLIAISFVGMRWIPVTDAHSISSWLWVLIPLPVGLSLVAALERRSGFFARYVLPRLLQTALIGIVMVIVATSSISLLGVPITAPIAFTLFLSFLVGEMTRRIARRGLEGGIERARAAPEDRLARFTKIVEEHHSSDEILESLVRMLKAQLESCGVTVVGRGAEIRCSDGRPLSTDAAGAALRLCSNSPRAVWLGSAGSGGGDDAETLRLEGVELLVRMDSVAADAGCLCVASRTDGGQYAHVERDYVEAIAHMASVTVQEVALEEIDRREQQVDTIGRVGAGMMHDIARRAGSISARARALTRAAALDASARVSAVRIEAMASEISDCVDRVTRFSIGQAGDADDEVTVHSLVESAVRSTTHIQPQAQISSVVECPDVVVRGGYDLHLSLVNLLDNALKASDTNACVEVRARCAFDTVVVEVEDQGCGIQLAKQRRVFDAFWTSSADGLGLGLSSVRSTVGRLGGKIELESEVGRGSQIRVTLPAVRAS